MTRRVLIGGGIGTLAVAGVGAGWAYNRYLAEHTQIEDTLAYEAAQQSKNNPSGTADPTELTGVSITDSGLTAQEGSITLKSYTEGSGNNAVVSFTAEVKLNNATLLRSAFANNKFGQNIIDTPSNIAAQSQRYLGHKWGLLRVPRHRHRHPQRRHLPRFARP